MVDLVRGLAVDPEAAPSASNPLRQVIINTHSPGLVRFVHARSRDALLVAKLAGVRGPEGRAARALRLLPLRGTWRTAADQPSADLVELLDYLSPELGTYETPPGGQVAISYAGEGEA